MKRNMSVANLFLFAFLAFLCFSQTTVAQDSRTQENSKSLLVGRWQSDEATVEIRNDGTLTINSEEFEYRIKGSVITISDDEGSVDIPFQLSGDRLIVTVEGRRITYVRLKGRAEQQNATGRDGIRRELVGKWCWISGVNLNSSNSRMTNRCFTLYENGTYDYYSETSSGGDYGSSASQESDSGRWSATSTTITAYSNTRGKLTFSLEKRNHPKTGDPMLILDGEVFVTAYRKEPW
jgi:hypothetical protein